MKRKREEEEKEFQIGKKCAYLNFFADFLVIFQLFGFDSG